MKADNQAFQAELEAAERGSQAESNSNNPSYPEEQQGGASGDRHLSFEKVNVFDYEVSSFDEEPSSRGQEMQETGGGELLGQ